MLDGLTEAGGLMSRRRRGLLMKLAVLLAGTCLALVVGEAALRVLLPRPDRLYVWPPRMRRTLRPLPGIMPGVEGDARFIVNSDGFRADELTPDFSYRILAVGGSTTECLYLDQDEAWPQLLQKGLDESQHSRKVWVGNAGKSGLNTRDNIVQLRHILEQFKQLDALILLVGVNDLSTRLKQDAGYDPDFMRREDAERQLLSRAFAAPFDESLPFYKRTAIWRLLMELKASVGPPREAVVEDEAGKQLAVWREHRRNASSIRRTLPDLNAALDEYARNVNAIIDLARQKSVRVIFVTQPSMWRPGLAPELSDLLWMGGVGNFQEEGGKEYLLGRGAGERDGALQPDPSEDLPRARRGVR
jgi:lysophospholipase L1-like esterase